jgi:hypothetical protein
MNPKSGRPASPQERSELLRLSRRLDWRFLLPAPQLGHVAYRGADIELIEALSHFSASLTLLDHPKPAHDFDVVVASNPSLQELQEDAATVCPGGCIYVELRRLGKAELSRPVSIPRHIAILDAMGLGETLAHWHFPDFATARAIVPLSDPGAIRYALSRRDSSFHSRAAAHLARIIVRARLFQLVLPCVSILARRPLEVSAPQ